MFKEYSFIIFLFLFMLEAQLNDKITKENNPDKRKKLGMYSFLILMILVISFFTRIY